MINKQMEGRVVVTTIDGVDDRHEDGCRGMARGRLKETDFPMLVFPFLKDLRRDWGTSSG